ncbi:hypothetical protein C7974DRAFT_104931 [Boeremia exigua]|uniref:uncharacterized protein n=1 Tax=Boeremia exigua TaxID=749465 RepID=UPI001E8DE884|nr:uncharacterized protein C7974DRAFT_104931 [Boeremia exigua]KAH6642577.1 hypothetical protein C7974DRAFT_104931 [Boeremia exigua]
MCETICYRRRPVVYPSRNSRDASDYTWSTCFSSSDRHPLLSFRAVVALQSFADLPRLALSLFCIKEGERRSKYLTVFETNRKIPLPPLSVRPADTLKATVTPTSLPLPPEACVEANAWRSMLRDVACSSQPESESDPRVAPSLSNAAQGRCQSATGLLISPVEHRRNAQMSLVWRWEGCHYEKHGREIERKSPWWSSVPSSRDLRAAPQITSWSGWCKR